MAEENNISKEKVLKTLKSSYEMYERTKKETASRMKSKLLPDGTKKYTEEDIKKEIEIIDNAEDDIIQQYKMMGGDENDFKKGFIKPALNLQDDSKVISDMIKELSEDTQSVPVTDSYVKPKEDNTNNKTEILPFVMPTSTLNEMKALDQNYIPSKGDYDPTETFDVIPLPSKGEAYKDKISKMSVAYLTAYDENMIVSPNLYRDNLILDYILQEKVLSKEIDPMDLLEGDREAIILFLRANGYGNEYPITATDDATGVEFDTVVDLSKLKYKEFNLKGDSNGWFSFTLPVTKKEVKFRFPTHRDTVILDKLHKAEENKTRKDSIKNCVSMLDTFIEAENEISKEDKVKVRQSIRAIEKWGDEINEENSLKYDHQITNQLNLLIMAIDGITDKKYISEYLHKMPALDSLALRRYITKNQPGIDYTITINRPESLGGGSFETFLQLDQLLFLTLPDGLL